MTEAHNGPQENKISKNGTKTGRKRTVGKAESVGKRYIYIYSWGALNVLPNKKLLQKHSENCGSACESFKSLITRCTRDFSKRSQSAFPRITCPYTPTHTQKINQPALLLSFHCMLVCIQNPSFAKEP